MAELHRREFMAMALGGLAGIAAMPGRAQETTSPQRPPNFIVILADDIGAKELACYGNTRHATPNLDALAAGGVQFQTCYATPLCHPTRLMLMTGQYGCHNGVYNFANRRGGPDPDSAAEEMTNHFTFAQLLKQQGYATALAGKWQLSGELPNLVRECGFDGYCMWAYAHNLPKGVKHEGGWEEGRAKTERYWHPCIVQDGEYRPTKPEDYGPDIHADYLIDFIRRNRERPFFAYMSECLTHAPHERTPETKGKEGAEYDTPEGRYKYCVEYMDKIVGRVVSVLDELGLRENTIVIFTGDNGTGGDGKGDPTELGARVPMIVNGPGIVKARSVTGELTDLSDVFPTLADFSGASLPADRVIDGKSLAPFLRGESDTTRDWIHSYLGDRRILRTQRYLLEDNSPFHYGRLYDCGTSRDGSGYRNVTDSADPEVAAVKKRFDELLAGLPAPKLDADGPLSESKRGDRKRARNKD